MKENASASYREAGVDTAEGQRFVRIIQKAVESTYSANVIKNPGGFAGLFDVSFLKKFNEPVLVSTTDGVGTKLQLAMLFNRHESIGIDLVAMCSNDLLVAGAFPMLFLDYIATGKVSPEKLSMIIDSISEGCRQCGASLMGGETAEHPGIMESDEYDLAGFMVGAAEKSKLIDGKGIQAGDLIIGLPSSGLHSNGFSLVRKLFLIDGVLLPESGEDRRFLLEDILLKATYIYEPVVRPLIESGRPIRGMVHITGGGYFENIPRILPDGLSAHLNRTAFPDLDVYRRIRAKGIPDLELFSVFNMGFGYLLIVPRTERESILKELGALWQKFAPASSYGPAILGEIVAESGEHRVKIS